MRDRLLAFLSPLVHLSSNVLSLIGVVLTTAGAVSWFFLLPTLVHGESQNPYVGILWSVDLSVFILGLILIPAGIHFRRVRLRRQGITEPMFPALTIGSGELRRLVGFMLATTFANVLIAGQLTYSAVNYLETPGFCGQVCHVLSPEFTAYQQSPHARVACVECHIGPGASWFVRSKISGTREVFAVLTHTYPTPIPSPVSNLRPARETCEHCHWPQRYTGNRVEVHTEYAEDETNTASTTVLMMKIGGHTWDGSMGIHGAHLAENTRFEYITTDPKRQTIAQVIYTAADGKQTVYNATDAKITPEELARGERRTMDCMDCHNRPTHVFQLPGRALDEALYAGRISSHLPFVRQQAAAALNKDYQDRETAALGIASSLSGFYKAGYPKADPAQVGNAIAAVQAIYARNVFPEMKVTWGTYVNNLGHMDSPGCFRCHDGSHTSASGRTIPSDCNTCHEIAAMGEKEPKILKELGIGGPP